MKHLLLTLMVLALSASATMRQEVPLDGEWLFSKTPSTGEKRQWERVVVPHCWNSNDGTTPDYYRGGGRYYYPLVIDSLPVGKRAFIRFEGVSQEAEVLVNGHNVGSHQGAFNAFIFEVTDLLHEGENNILVNATNRWNENIAPLEGDFTIFGGIYRPVSLLWLPDNCISPLDYASSGTYITQKNVSDDNASLEIVTKLDGEVFKGKNNYKLKATVFDPDGRLVATGNTRCGKDRGGRIDVKHNLRIDNPRLWSPENSENLYKVYYELTDGKAVVDTLSETIGLRYFHIDPEKGFFLNGKPYRLAGVNRHQDRPGKGWAISKEDHDEDMALINEIGANTIRLAHYPHSEYFYDLCDRNGKLVWAEIPFIGHGTDSPEFSNNLKQQLVELIRQNYNHPSIFIWSLFNEIGFGEHRDVKPDGIVAELNDIAHREDPSRPTIGATNRDDLPENTIPDYVAHNSYPGWYVASPAAMGEMADGKNLGNGVAFSEYGAGASVYCHDSSLTTPPVPGGHYHPEEWQSAAHEEVFRQLEDRPFVWATWVWNMFDFASSWRNEGDARGINDKGLVTYDRKTPKDAFYFYKSQWSDDPMVHITSKRHTIRDRELTDVKVYSNCDNVELKINGKAYEVKSPVNGVTVWKEIELTPGNNEIEVKGYWDGTVVTDNCSWYLFSPLNEEK